MIRKYLLLFLFFCLLPSGIANGEGIGDFLPKTDINAAPQKKSQAARQKKSAYPPSPHEDIKPLPDNSDEQAAYPGIRDGLASAGGNGLPTFTMHYPIFGNQKVDAAILAMVEKEKREYLEFIATTKKEFDDPQIYRNWENSTTYSINKPNPNVVSIAFYTYSDAGGAHPNHAIATQAFDLQSGMPLQFEDFFENPRKALTLLSSISIKKLRKEYPDADRAGIEEGAAPSKNNFRNIVLTPNGLSVLFQAYQVMAYAFGEPVVEIKLSALRNAAPNPEIWPQAGE